MLIILLKCVFDKRWCEWLKAIGTPKTLIPFEGVVNWDGVLKLNNRRKGNHVTHLWSWIKKPIAQSLVCEYSYANDIIERGPMMWMSFVMDGNKQESK
jgi:hypothetical protein